MEEGVRGNLLDPAAAEFHPSPPLVVPATSFSTVGYPQIYYPYPPPPQPPVTQFFTGTPAVPAYHNQYMPQVLPPASAFAPTTTVAVLEGLEATAAASSAATRSVALSFVPRGVREAELRADMELFGGVRGLEMGALQAEGVVTVHFYDLRSAQAAVDEICAQHSRRQTGIGYGVGVPCAGNWNLQTPQWEWRAPQGVAGDVFRGLIAGHAVWARFAFDEQQHRSSIVVMNSDPNLSLLALRQLFETFGAVRDVREMATKPLHKFVEFFDTRDAARAYSELNCRKFHGRRLVLEFTRPFSGSQTSNYAKRSSNLAPRFLRGSSKPAQHGRWNQGTSSSFSPISGTPAGTGSNQQEPVGAPPVVLLQRSQTNAATTSSSSSTIACVGGCSSISSGKRNKNSSTHQSSSSSATASSKQQQQHQQTSGSKKGWKNQTKSNGGDKRFLFEEVELDDSAASASRDPRTTVMIRNIPNKYSQKLLLNMLDNHCIHCNEQIGDGDDDPYSAYDFVYLPIDFNNKCNVGYGFVNLTSPEAAFRLYKAFHHQPWEVFNSRKICQVTYARLQGLEALMEHFRNSKFACDNDEYMPVYFSPPRDGKMLTEPVPVVPREGSDTAVSLTKQVVDGLSRTQDAAEAFLQAELGGASSTTASTHAPSDNADDDEDDVGRRSSGYDHDDDKDGVDEDCSGSGLNEALLKLSCCGN